MKVLFIHNYYQQYGGEDTVVKAEKNLLTSYGNKVTVYSRLNSRVYRYSFLKKVNLYLSTHWSKDDYFDIKNIIQKENPDIAHIHNTFLLITPSAYYACRDSGLPIVQTLHNYRFLCPGGNLYIKGLICEECLKEKSFKKSLANGCWRNSRLLTASVTRMLKYHIDKGTFKNSIDCYIALTEFSKNKFIEAGYDPKKMVVKPNFVSFDPAKREKVGKYILFVGRLSEEKGVWLLVNSWNKLNNLPLKIIGTGDLLKDLVKYSRMKKLNIDFLGQKSHEDVLSYIKNAAFVVLPSKCYETFGRVIIESFACSVPVVATKLGAMGELIQDNKTGLLFKEGDRDDLVRKINYLWERKDLIEELGRNAREEYENKYTAEKNYDMLIKIYNQVIESGKKHSGRYQDISSR